MEPTQQSHQPNEDTNNNNNNNVGNGGGGGGAKGSFLCRQSSTRWTPTTDQIRILKDLYYNNGIRSPNADQIQKISARLRQYGKIEGKNVFYWFQNHKARERQKKRFTPDNHLVVAPANGATNLQQQQQQQQLVMRSNNSFGTIIDSPPEAAAATWKLADHHETKLPISCIATSAAGFPAVSSSPAGLVGVGHIGSYGYGPKTMEKSFRECSISSQASSTMGGSRSHNYGWIATNYTTNYDPFRPTTTNTNYNPPRGSGGRQILNHNFGYPEEEQDQEEEEDEEEEEEEEEVEEEVETLPLFPMHNEDHSFHGGYFRNNNFRSPSSTTTTSYYSFGNNGGSCTTSLELSLNSLVGHSHDAL